MKKVKKLPANIVKLFDPLLEAEYTAFYFYKGAANWCKGAGFNLAAKFFEKESQDELEHAYKLQAFLVDWNINPELPMVDPIQSDDFVKIISDAYDLEYALYEKYEEVSATAFESGDICVFDLFQFFRGAQTKSVAEYSDMINMLEGCNTESKFELLMLEEKLFGE